jgi:hypothetical protein
VTYILKAPEVKIIGASNHKSLFLNIDGHSHRSGDYKKDCYAFEKGIKLFCLSGADSMFFLDASVTDSKKKHSLSKKGFQGLWSFSTRQPTPQGHQKKTLCNAWVG